MAKYLPQGYIDCALGIQRDDDPDPYSITFGAEIETPPWTQQNNDDLYDRLTVAMQGILNDHSTFTNLTTKVGSDGEGPLIESTGLVAGLRNVASSAPNVSILVRKSTGLGGRYNRGRNYWPSFDRTFVLSNGTVSPGEVTLLQAGFDAMLEVLGGAVGTPPVNLTNMSLIHSPRAAEATPTPTPITALIVENLVATQRRRLRN